MYKDSNHKYILISDIFKIIFAFLSIGDGIHYLYIINNMKRGSECIQKLKLYIETYEQLHHISKLSDIMYLDMNCQDIYDLSSLQYLSNLKYLTLKNVNDNKLSVFKHLTNLTHLSIFKCNDNLSDLKYLTLLKSLTLDVCLEIDDMSLKFLTSISNFTSLNIKLCPKIKNIKSLLLNQNVKMTTFRYSDLLSQYAPGTILGYIVNNEKKIIEIEIPSNSHVRFRNRRMKNYNIRELKTLYKNLGISCVEDLNNIKKEEIIDIIWNNISILNHILYFSPFYNIKSYGDLF